MKQDLCHKRFDNCERNSKLSNKRVLIAMSGGIDSTVAAILLQEKGYQLVGVTYRVYDQFSHECTEREGGYGSVNAISEAKQMAEKLGFEHHILDLRHQFKERVISDFIDEYLNGRTPNPCVLCNSVIKWGELTRMADKLGCQYIATGHYARIGSLDGRYFLRKGVDKSKDQTYFLWMLTQDNLARTIFPLGELTKPEVRKIAYDRGYVALSQKQESQEICFIPDNNYRRFLAESIDNYAIKCQPGDFIDSSGNRLGEHSGFPNYTIGQRKGLGIALGEPMFVLSIDPLRNKVVLGRREELKSNDCTINNINLMKYTSPEPGFETTVKIRYRSKGLSAKIFMEGSDRCRILFNESADAVTPGQSAVIYEGEDLIGGGIILNNSKYTTL